MTRLAWRSKLIGEYAVGERPDPLDVHFVHADGTAVNLSGFTAEGNLRAPDGTVVDVTAAPVGAPADGVARFTWPLPNPITDPGRWRLEVWVGNATTRRYLSRRFHFYARTPLQASAV